MYLHSVTQSCRTLCSPVDCSPPGFSIHGIIQAKILELPNVNGVMDSRGHDKALGLLEDSERLLKSRPHYCCCSITQSCLTLYDSIECSTPGLSVPHRFPKFAQVHIHRIGDAIQPSHPLTPSSPSALNFSQHQGLFQRKIRPVYCHFPCASNDTFSGSM